MCIYTAFVTTFYESVASRLRFLFLRRSDRFCFRSCEMAASLAAIGGSCRAQNSLPFRKGTQSRKLIALLRVQGVFSDRESDSCAINPPTFGRIRFMVQAKATTQFQWSCLPVAVLASQPTPPALLGVAFTLFATYPLCVLLQGNCRLRGDGDDGRLQVSIGLQDGGL